MLFSRSHVSSAPMASSTHRYASFRDRATMDEDSAQDLYRHARTRSDPKQTTVAILGVLLDSASRRDRELFSALVTRWRQERPRFSSSLAEIIACPSYLRIIAMGRKALPLIMERLEREGDEPDHWCAALEAITGEDPVPEESVGDTVGIAKAWLAWNKTRKQRFLDSMSRIAESPALTPTDTTALLGRLSALPPGGGPLVEREAIGRPAFLSNQRYAPLLRLSERSPMKSAPTDHWKPDTRRLPSSCEEVPRRTLLDNFPVGAGPANWGNWRTSSTTWWRMSRVPATGSRSGS